MLNGVAIYSVTLGIISSYFSDRETKSSLIETKAARIEELCQEIGIPEKQKNKMIEAIENSANQMTYFWLDPSHDILTGLPIRLKYEMLVSMYRQLIMECPFFSDLGETHVLELGNGVLRPALTGLVSQNSGKHEQGTALGMLQSISSVAGMIAPPLGGLLLNQGWLLPWGLLASGFAACGLALSASRQREKVPAEPAP